MATPWYTGGVTPQYGMPGKGKYWYQSDVGPFGGVLATPEGRETRALGALWSIMPLLGGAQAEWAGRTLGGMANTLSQGAGLSPDETTQFYNQLQGRGQFAAPSASFAPGQYTTQLGRNINALTALSDYFAGPAGGWGPSQVNDYLKTVLGSLGQWGPQGGTAAGLTSWQKPSTYNEWMDFQRRMAQAAAIRGGEEVPSYVQELVRTVLSPEEYYTMPTAFAAPPARRTSSWWS